MRTPVVQRFGPIIRKDVHMVHDVIANAASYSTIGPRIAQALEFLQKGDLAGMPAGRYDIDGRTVYALVQDYTSKPMADGRWEAHRKYIDLQFVVSGRERFGYAPAGRMADGAYDEEKDLERPVGESSFVELRAGEFILLWPGEPHMPGMALDEPATVRKVVVKIAAS
jgi:YhcH/YjgK/YiaL family protein